MAVKRFGFSLDRVATPARAVQLPVQEEEGPVKKIPKLSDLIPITQGPQPPPYLRRQEKADVEVHARGNSDKFFEKPVCACVCFCAFSKSSIANCYENE